MVLQQLLQRSSFRGVQQLSRTRWFGSTSVMVRIYMKIMIFDGFSFRAKLCNLKG